MAKKFSVRNYVAWCLDSGHSVGKIVQVHTRDVDFNGQTYRASEEDPQYEIQCGTSGPRVMQKGAALTLAKNVGLPRLHRINTRR